MFVGIDLGTSNIKAVLVDEQQRVIAEASRPVATIRPGPVEAEQDPDAWIELTAAALAELRSKAPAAFAATEAIGLSGQMHGLVALDASLRPLRPCILWSDGRAAAEAEALWRNHAAIADEVGVLPMASFVGPKLAWLAHREPATLRRLRLVLMPKDYLRLWLTGETGTDMVDAAGAWLLDEARRDWSDAALAACGVDRSVMPRLHESIAPVARLLPARAAELGLPAGCVVVAGAGDAAAGSIGLGQVSDGDALISLGTASQFFVTTGAYRPAVATLIHAFAHAAPGLWFQMAAMLNGAAALAWWAGICGASPGDLEREAAHQGRQGEALFLPYLAGERTPHNDLHASGAFHGLRAAQSRADLTRAVMEGVAFTLADARDALLASGTAIGPVGLSGGGAKSRFWAQLIADAIDRPILIYSSAIVGPAFGAARLARLGVRDEALAAICLKPPVDAAIEPNADGVASAAERLPRWRALYRALRS
jgi:xylulokinase